MSGTSKSTKTVGQVLELPATTRLASNKFKVVPSVQVVVVTATLK